MEILSKRLLARILPVIWEQPILYSNGTVGSSEMAVKEAWTNGGYRPYVSGRTGDGTTAWYAFRTTGGYTAPYATGFGDDGENSGWYYLWIYTKKKIKATSLTFCFPGLDSDNDGGWAFRRIKVSASNDSNCWSSASHSSWSQLYYYETTVANEIPRGADYNTTKTFRNNNYYNYYLLGFGTNGGGHNDGLTVSSVRLGAVYEDFV